MDIYYGAAVRRALCCSIHVSTGPVSILTHSHTYTAGSQICAVFIHYMKLLYMAHTGNTKKRQVGYTEWMCSEAGQVPRYERPVLAPFTEQCRHVLMDFNYSAERKRHRAKNKTQWAFIVVIEYVVT